MNRLQENSFILKTDIAWGPQKLGLTLENKVPQNLKLAITVFNIIAYIINISYIENHFRTAGIDI